MAFVSAVPFRDVVPLSFAPFVKVDGANNHRAYVKRPDGTVSSISSVQPEWPGSSTRPVEATLKQRRCNSIHSGRTLVSYRLKLIKVGPSEVVMSGTDQDMGALDGFADEDDRHCADASMVGYYHRSDNK